MPLPLERPAGEIIVRPVPEHRADEALASVYRDVKTALGVPWVGVIVQAVAFYRPFFLEAWRQLRPTAASRFFDHAGSDLRRFARDGMASAFPTATHVEALQAAGYSERELAQIRATLDQFEDGNPKYLILATAIAECLAEDRPIGGLVPPDSDSEPRTFVVETGAIPTMIEEHHASGDLVALYGDIKHTLTLPFVNSDYKAMARWPTYLAHAWASLKPLLGEPGYGRLRESIHTRALNACDAFPYRYAMDRRAASAAGLGPEAIDELSRTIWLFQWLLSGLILNVTYFRLALGETPGR